MSSHSMKYLLLCVPFMLTACGDGWEMIRVDNVVPYGNTRTAGSGVAYVRAKLLPPKDVNVAPAAAQATTTTTTTTTTPAEVKPAVAPAPQPAEAKTAEPVFQKGQQK